MDKFYNYIILNSKISQYFKDYDDEENVHYFISYISVYFNNKYYYTSIVDINNNFLSYKEHLYSKIKNIIINDLGKQQIKQFF